MSRTHQLPCSSITFGICTSRSQTKGADGFRSEDVLGLHLHHGAGHCGPPVPRGQAFVRLDSWARRKSAGWHMVVGQNRCG